MPIPQIVGLLGIAALAWFWFDSLNVRETAIRAVRSACESEGLQLLDDTVASSGLWAERDGEGRLRLRRNYQFEYSDTGDNRRRGSVVLLGRRVVVINIGLRLVPSQRTLH